MLTIAAPTPQIAHVRPCTGLEGSLVRAPCTQCGHVAGAHEYPSGICGPCHGIDYLSLIERLAHLERTPKKRKTYKIAQGYTLHGGRFEHLTLFGPIRTDRPISIDLLRRILHRAAQLHLDINTVSSARISGADVVWFKVIDLDSMCTRRVMTR